MAVTRDGLGYQIMMRIIILTNRMIFERYIDPKFAELAIRSVVGPDGKRVQFFAGKPSKYNSDQVTFSKEELTKLLGDTSTIGRGRVRLRSRVGPGPVQCRPGFFPQ